MAVELDERAGAGHEIESAEAHPMNQCPEATGGDIPCTSILSVCQTPSDGVAFDNPPSYLLSWGRYRSCRFPAERRSFSEKCPAPSSRIASSPSSHTEIRARFVHGGPESRLQQQGKLGCSDRQPRCRSGEELQRRPSENPGSAGAANAFHEPHKWAGKLRSWNRQSSQTGPHREPRGRETSGFLQREIPSRPEGGEAEAPMPLACQMAIS